MSKGTFFYIEKYIFLITLTYLYFSVVLNEGLLIVMQCCYCVTPTST